MIDFKFNPNGKIILNFEIVITVVHTGLLSFFVTYYWFFIFLLSISSGIFFAVVGGLVSILYLSKSIDVQNDNNIYENINDEDSIFINNNNGDFINELDLSESVVSDLSYTSSIKEYMNNNNKE